MTRLILTLLLLVPTLAFAGPTPPETCHDTLLSIADISTLDTVPVVIAPGPGAAKAIVPTTFQWLRGSGGQWTSPGTLFFAYDSGEVITSIGPIFKNSATGVDRIFQAAPLVGGADIVFQAGAPVTGGTQTLKLRVCYLTTPVSF